MEDEVRLHTSKMYSATGTFKYKILGERRDDESELKQGQKITAINTRSLKAVFDLEAGENKLIMVEALIEGMGMLKAICKLASENKNEKVLDIIVIKNCDLALIDGYISDRLNSSL